MTEPATTIRPVAEDDLSEWFRLRRLLWDATSDEDHQSEMLDILDHPDTQLVLVADRGTHQLLGFLEASIRPFVDDCETDNVGYLEGWYVESEFRRQGVGSLLVRAAEQWAVRHGASEMASDAEVGNELSLSAHLHLGYEETSRLVHLRKVIQ